MKPKSQSIPVLLFADGASSGNPGPSGWGAVIVTPKGEVHELGGGVPSSTNNRMELSGVIRGLDKIGALKLDDQEIEVFTDSTYVIRGITAWIFGWLKRGWKTAEGEDVANKDLWVQLLSATKGKKISWKYVRGHAGIPGNERVDQIAVAYTKGERPHLYTGPLLQYGVAIHDLPESFELPQMREKAEKKAAYSYLSVVNGVPMRHATWPECELRVKGRSGAKFKKTLSAAEEGEILAAWGFDTKDLK